jgi:hypothetical protein
MHFEVDSLTRCIYLASVALVSCYYNINAGNPSQNQHHHRHKQPIGEREKCLPSILQKDKQRQGLILRVMSRSSVLCPKRPKIGVPAAWLSLCGVLSARGGVSWCTMTTKVDTAGSPARGVWYNNVMPWFGLSWLTLLTVISSIQFGNNLVSIALACATNPFLLQWLAQCTMQYRTFLCR